MDVTPEAGPHGFDFGAAIMATSRSIVITDCTLPDNPIIFVNKAFTNLTGYTAEEAIGRNCRFLQGPDTDSLSVAQLREALSSGQSVRCELLNYRKNGEPFWNEVTIDPIRDPSGRMTSLIGVQHDATDKHAVEHDREEAEERLATLAAATSSYAFQRVLHADGTIEYPYISRSFFRILGLPEDVDWMSGGGIAFVHPEDRARMIEAVKRSADELKPMLFEYRLLPPSGEEHWFRTESTPRALPNGDIVWDGLSIDVTAEKLLELQLSHLARHDALTGLPNRLSFNSAMVDAIAAAFDKDHQVAVFYIDIDDFQAFNDLLGQPFGDQVLVRTGQRLAEFAAGRGGLAARIGGDEFALLISNLPAAPSPVQIAEAICRELSRKASIDEQEMVIEVSIGVAVCPFPGEPHPAGAEDAAAALLKRAQLALQAAKQGGPGTFRLYSTEQDDQFQNRLALRQSLQQAIHDEQFELHYQPLVDLTSGEIVGAEALVRWRHPELGLQRRDLFIPLAETSGLIVPLGAWVLKDAMKQVQAWKRRGVRTPRVAVNVSGVRLHRPGFIASVEKALTETGADPHDFEFELTEGTLIEASPGILTQLNALKSLGFGLTIDDFGAGHSQFRYLREFPIDKIKIDQVFVKNLGVHSSDAPIIRSMINLARSLKLKIVAEGIETAMQLSFLRTEGCPVGQGYFLSLPLSAEDFGWMLENRVILPMQGDARTDAPEGKRDGQRRQGNGNR